MRGEYFIRSQENLSLSLLIQTRQTNSDSKENAKAIILVLTIFPSLTMADVDLVIPCLVFNRLPESGTCGFAGGEP
jgi:hypothetical protein